MVPSGWQQSRKTDGEARERLVEAALDILSHPLYRGLFWCDERKQYFRWAEYTNTQWKKNKEK